MQPLSDAQIALIANYVLANYGNARLSVTPDDVRQARQGGPAPLLARAQPYMLPAAVTALLIVLLGLLLLRRRRA